MRERKQHMSSKQEYTNLVSKTFITSAQTKDPQRKSKKIEIDSSTKTSKQMNLPLRSRSKKSVICRVDSREEIIRDRVNQHKHEGLDTNLTPAYPELDCYDSLTGLPNRKHFQQALSQLVKRAREDNAAFTLIYIDLDNFKQINYLHGTLIGDFYLIEVVNLLKKFTMESDYLARTGGDEFALILNGISSTSHICKRINKIFTAFSEPIEVSQHTLTPSLSMGVAIYPYAGTTSDELFTNADLAMGRAKDSGKNQFAFFNKKINEKVQRFNLIKHELAKAVKNSELTLVYQPQYCVKTQRIIGVEVLVRWPHPQLIFPSPAEFIAVAEASSLITDMDHWIVMNAIKEFNGLLALLEKKDISLSINLSAENFRYNTFCKLVKKAIANIHLPELLIFEITETSFIKELSLVKEMLTTFSNEKIRFAIDDFGTGYSTFNYLKHFPISHIKIDRGFIKNLDKAREDKVIIETMISLAKKLDLTVVAEGVESAQQLAYLEQVGCDIAQGFYLGKPEPYNVIKQLVA